MLTEERKQTILNRIEQQGIVKNTVLAKELNTSMSTIRRDLQELEEEQLIRRVHGGATKLQPLTKEDSLLDKTSKFVQEKKQIAKMAASYVKDNMVIFLDAGSSTFEMIPYLKQKQLTVVTNSVAHASELIRQHIPTYIIGGMIKENTNAIVNATALAQLREMRFDLSFIGTNSVSEDFGYATTDTEEASIKHLAMTHSHTAYILADHSKFDASSFITFANLDEAILITDDHPSDCKEHIKAIIPIKEVSQ